MQRPRFTNTFPPETCPALGAYCEPHRAAEVKRAERNLVFLSFSALERRHTAVKGGRAGKVTAALCQHNVRHSRLILHS